MAEPFMPSRAVLLEYVVRTTADRVNAALEKLGATVVIEQSAGIPS
jgi:hypothetical protein